MSSQFPFGAVTAEWVREEHPAYKLRFAFRTLLSLPFYGRYTAKPALAEPQDFLGAKLVSPIRLLTTISRETGLGQDARVLLNDASCSISASLSEQTEQKHQKGNRAR